MGPKVHHRTHERPPPVLLFLLRDASPRNTPTPPEIRVGDCFTSGLFCLQRKHLAYEQFLTLFFLRGGVVSASPNPQAGGPPVVGCLRLLIQFIRSYRPYRRQFLHPQPEVAPCRGDRDPQTRLEADCNFQNYTCNLDPILHRNLQL